VRLVRGERLWLGAERDAARIGFETPARVGERALDWLARSAARVGLLVKGGWRTV
jgi:hypothetical protein